MTPASRVARRAAAVAVIVLAADQLTKELVRSSIALGQQRRLLPGVTLVHAQNSGIAFSLFTGSEVGVVVVAAVIIAAVVAYFARHHQQRWMWLACGLIVGGALGNLVDRLRVGTVTDFIKLPDWPAFNLADASITLGVLTVLWVVGRGGAAARPA
ncbi:MAG: signal peptidase II [Solirubrobacteraceae bacterium]|jgi:signal peptidase II